MFYLDAFKTISQTLISQSSKKLRWPGIEPGSNAWKASMLTITPPTLGIKSFLEQFQSTFPSILDTGPQPGPTRTVRTSMYRGNRFVTHKLSYFILSLLH